MTTLNDLVETSRSHEDNIQSIKRRIIALADAISGPVPASNPARNPTEVGGMPFVEAMCRSQNTHADYFNDICDHIIRLEQVIVVSDSPAGRMIGSERAAPGTNMKNPFATHLDPLNESAQRMVGAERVDPVKVSEQTR
jgi:hypothetical protein